MPTGYARDREIERVRTFTRAMDHYGVDPLIGLLLPGVGDILGAIIGLYIISIAQRRGLSRAAIARMVLNLGLDTLVGAIPLVGDIGDFLFKANDKNLRILEQRIATPGRNSTAADWAWLAGSIAAVLSVCGLIVWGFVKLVEWIF